MKEIHERRDDEKNDAILIATVAFVAIVCFLAGFGVAAALFAK